MIEGVEKNELGQADAGDGRDDRARAREGRCSRRAFCILDEHDDLVACVLVPSSPPAKSEFLGARANPSPPKKAQTSASTPAFVWPIAGEVYVDQLGREVQVLAVRPRDRSDRHVEGLLFAPGEGRGKFYACSAEVFGAVWRKKS